MRLLTHQTFGLRSKYAADTAALLHNIPPSSKFVYGGFTMKPARKIGVASNSTHEHALSLIT